MTSRLRAPPSHSLIARGPGVPRRWVSCGKGSAIVEWSPARVVALAEPLVSLLAPVRAWDLGAQERAFIGAELATWPYPGTWGRGRASVVYHGCANAAPPPLVQHGVSGNLAAALVEIQDRRSRALTARRAG